MAKKRIIQSGVVALAVLLGAGLWFFGRPMYHRWKERRFLAQGQAYLQKSELANAWICGVQAISLNSKNPATCRLLAEVAERRKSPQAIQMRRQVAELEPNVLENRLAWAHTALNLEYFPFPLAAEALASIDAAGQRTAGYHATAAALALKRNNLAQAEFHFSEAAKLEPENDMLRMNLAAIRLRSRDPAVVAEAQRTLQTLRTNAACRLPALRSLVNLGLEQKNWGQAQAFAKELLAATNADFSDQLLRLTVLHQSTNAEFAAALTSVQKEAGKNPTTVYALASWLTANGLVDLALPWLLNLPENLRKEHPVPLALAEVYAVKAKWSELDAMLRSQNWGQQDFLRLAILARALRAEGEKQAADVNWRKAVRLAAEHPEPLSLLSQMADAWGWQAEAEEAVWLIANKFPDRNWALRGLYQIYLARGDTRRLRDVYAALLKLNPADAVAKNNLATVSFLLNSDLDQAHTQAEEIYKQDPKNPGFVSTYAYSLHLRGKTKEGLKVFQTLTPQQLQTPSIALYYGLMLAADGEAPTAKKYLALAGKAQLLPEESALLAAAKKAANSSG